MQLSPQQIEQIATLARLDLSESEKTMYAKQISVILDYIDMLNEVDTTVVEETCQVTGLEDVFREDKVADCDEEVRKNIITQFPEKQGNLLKVKAVFQAE
ncbi:MAG: Asp-tRNA(Asn)/Glu-tRNA(Gln) amidotransferase GatCAB subunit C [Candidatus Magasanikbacteria bacterium CG_4_10_14_0_2_um_filter_37_12]|uniref:Aspartyl/glutamyl-tRNA(Asn/Gln) amidotransferase subunit C n=1 Tax=Candidatus Magasanikbacteria bacterium CG_4_10_14_0_2_um_filter_37_12 TaxID=1974637 RepID=A0A2M7V8X5_9BACT|nr:MAG: Asp-tRNA(Asn)/Glu-tRNA(Gln) amidotransferase GatCAB subunit C [Candidatus Magasanikbacteria bacterium CG_4_10_14_0_2_um_filter_37_12]